MQMEEEQQTFPRSPGLGQCPAFLAPVFGRHPPGASNYAAITWIINNRYPTAARTHTPDNRDFQRIIHGRGLNAQRDTLWPPVDLSMQRLFEFSSVSSRISSASDVHCG